MRFGCGTRAAGGIPKYDMGKLKNCQPQCSKAGGNLLTFYFKPPVRGLFCWRAVTVPWYVVSKEFQRVCVSSSCAQSSQKDKRAPALVVHVLSFGIFVIQYGNTIGNHLFPYHSLLSRFYIVCLFDLLIIML